MGKETRLVPIAVSVSSSIGVTVDTDYRYDGSPTRHIYVVKTGASAAVGGPAITFEAGPTRDGPWVPFAEVTAVCTATIIQFNFEPPFIKVSCAGGGPLVTIYAVI